MVFELTYRIYGDLKIDQPLKAKLRSLAIVLFEEKEKFYISVSKNIDSNKICLPVFEDLPEMKRFILPSQECYKEMEEIVNHFESFGSLDNKLEYIDKLNVVMKWIPDNVNDHYSPLAEIERKINNEGELSKISNDWFTSTIMHKNQLGDLYIPFSFLRDGKLFFNSMRYQSSFCTFYMMLEYFFNEKQWGIKNDAFKRFKCLKSSLSKCLDEVKKYEQHHSWLEEEMLRRNKKYNEEGLLFTINRFRDELSHASEKDKNRNPFNEHKYFSLTFITMIICTNVSIKKRLLYFVHPNDRDVFLER